MKVKFRLSGTLGDDSGSWDDPASDADTSFLGLGSNTLAYAVLAAGALLLLPHLSDGGTQRRITSGRRKRRSPRGKLTNGVKGKRRTINLSRQPDGSFA